MVSIKFNRKGFTLIELLAVILILGIIALIAVPVVNDVLNDSRMGAFKTTAMNLASKAEENCQLEGIKDKEATHLYTIVDGELDKPLEIKGDIPNEGYILVNSNCEVAYSFYDSKNVVSKNFKEDTQTINNKDTAPVYGLKWQSNKTTLDDTYTRTHDSSSIEDDAVKAQIGETTVTNAFDDLDIYKDILPYTDEFGNEFMLIPKFYISKTKEETDTENIWNYAVSKHKLDNTYYLPSNFVDEGLNNDKKIELPYVLVGKYEAGSNGLTGEEEMLVSKSGLMPRVNINIIKSREIVNRYNTDDIKGYQQYDIHVHDLITMLFAIEFKTMDSQKVMYGLSSGDSITTTGESDVIKSSSGQVTESNSAFHYRGIENLWGNVWSIMEGINIDQINDTRDNIYVSLNSRLYKSNDFGDDYIKVEGYRKINSNGVISDIAFDPKVPFLLLPNKVEGFTSKGVGDYYYQGTDELIKISLIGGSHTDGPSGGLNYVSFAWNQYAYETSVGARLIKLPMRD